MLTKPPSYRYTLSLSNLEEENRFVCVSFLFKFMRLSMLDRVSRRLGIGPTCSWCGRFMLVNCENNIRCKQTQSHSCQCVSANKTNDVALQSKLRD